MPFWMLISDFLNDLKVQRTRVFLTTFAIIWGTLAIVLLMAFGRGFKERMVASMLNAGNQIIRVYGGQTSIKYQGLPEGRWIRFTKDDADVLLHAICDALLGASGSFAQLWTLGSSFKKWNQNSLDLFRSRFS